MKQYRACLLLLCCGFFALPLSAFSAQAPFGEGVNRLSLSSESQQPRVILLVQNKQEQVQGPVQGPQPGTLVLPANVETQNLNEKSEKQCMTVCARWGEECTFINRGIGGMSKKCRRACKQFTEECF